MGDSGQSYYEDDDERRAKFVNGLINPIADRGEDPDQPFQMQGTQYPALKPGDPRSGYGMTSAQRQGQVRLPNDGQVSTTDAEPPSSPPTAPATGPKSFKDYVRAGLVGQDRDATASEATTAQLAAQPDEATVTKPLLDQRAKDSAYIDPTDPQYRPSVGQRIFRGIKAVAGGIAEGGVFGGLAEGLNADYKAPTRAYDRATAKQARTVASDDAQISGAQKAYQDATARAKGISVEERANAISRHDEASDATKEETEQNNAGRDAETVRHNQADERLRGQQEQNTSTYQQGELKNRRAEIGVQAGRLAFDKHKDELDRAAGNTPGGDENIRQPLIDQAAAKLTRFKAGVTYKPEFGNYLTEAGKPMSQDEYIAQINQIGADLDEALAKKKQPPLGLRYKGGPNGQEIPFQTPQTQPAGGNSPNSPNSPAPAAAPAATPAKPAKGDMNGDTLPAAAAASLKKGQITTFNNGERWKLGDDGKPVKLGQKKK